MLWSTLSPASRLLRLTESLRTPMSLETASYINQLDPANPSGTDRVAQGDDHLRLLKTVLKATFPNIDAPVTVTPAFLNSIAAFLVPFGLISAYYGAVAPSGWAICDGSTVSRSDGLGTIVVPDLRDRTIVGASITNVANSYWGQALVTATSDAAGAHGHTATIAAAGSHSHTGNTGSTTLLTSQVPTHSHYTFANVSTTYDTLQAYPDGAPARGGSGGSSGASYNIGSDGTTPATVGKTTSSGGGLGHVHTISTELDHTHSGAVSDVPGHAHTVSVAVSQPSYALNFIMKI